MIVCPICGTQITVDSTFVARECGHAVLLTDAGILVATPDLEATRARLSRWAYEPAIAAAELTTARRGLMQRATQYASPAEWEPGIEHSQ